MLVAIGVFAVSLKFMSISGELISINTFMILSAFCFRVLSFIFAKGLSWRHLLLSSKTPFYGYEKILVLAYFSVTVKLFIKFRSLILVHKFGKSA